MKTNSPFSFFHTCLLVACLAPALAHPIEVSTVDSDQSAWGPNSVRRTAFDTGARAVLQNADSQINEMLNCQNQGKLWNGTTCVSPPGGGPLITNPGSLTVQMMPQQNVYGTVPTGIHQIIPGGSHNCGLFGISTCYTEACQEPLYCNPNNLIPQLRVTGSTLQVYPRICTVAYRSC